MKPRNDVAGTPKGGHITRQERLASVASELMDQGQELVPFRDVMQIAEEQRLGWSLNQAVLAGARRYVAERKDPLQGKATAFDVSPYKTSEHVLGIRNNQTLVFVGSSALTGTYAGTLFSIEAGIASLTGDNSANVQKKTVNPEPMQQLTGKRLIVIDNLALSVADMVIRTGLTRDDIHNALRSIRRDCRVDTDSQLLALAYKEEKIDLNNLPDTLISELNPRQLKLVTDYYDHTDDEAATLLKLKRRTVVNEWKRIKKQLSIGDRRAAYIMALRERLVDFDKILEK